MARRTYHPTIEQLERDLAIYADVFAQGLCSKESFDKNTKYLKTQIKRKTSLAVKHGR